MIQRYVPRDFDKLWSDKNRYDVWLEIELTACEVMEQVGLVPSGVSNQIRSNNIIINPDRVVELEAITRHDVIAFLTHVEELAGSQARWLHLGMTSSDVVDTAFAIILRDSSNALETRLNLLLSVLSKKAREHAHVPMMGRSHGMHAEPITFGLMLAGHHAELMRGLIRLKAAKEGISVGKIAGAVGTYAHLDPEVESKTLERLGLRPETIPTQIVSRDRHAAFFSSIALIAASIERLATNIRHLQRTEVAEVEESFGRGQKGSSAMPHKRNPIISENLCGLSRLVRASVAPALENVSLWNERDISHSSVERVIAPDVTSVLAFMIDRSIKLIEGLIVNDQKMMKNLESTGGLCFSEGVLLNLVGKGISRQEAYVWVQRNAMRALNGEASFRRLLSLDSDIILHMSDAELNGCFDLEHLLRHVDALIERGLSA